MQQKMKGAFDRLSQTCSMTLIMQMIVTSEPTTTVTYRPWPWSYHPQLLCLGSGGLVGVCMCVGVRGWCLEQPEASTLAHVYFVSGLAVISF